MMDEKNDLINNINGGDDKKLRKYLFIGGSVFILFVVVVVVSKFFFAPKNNDTKVILPTEIKQPKAEKDKDTNLFKDIPVDDNTAVLDENQFKKPENDNQNMDTMDEKPVEQPAKPKPAVENKPQVQNVEPIAKEQKVQPKKVVKEVKKVKPVVHHKYYIQVAAVIRTAPSKRFLNLIKKNGFEYTIVDVNVKGNNVKRVLVGPYDGYSEAKKALVKVRKTISSSAFIKRVK